MKNRWNPWVQFALNHLDIAAQRDALAEHFDAVETAERANFIGFFGGMGRVVAVFDRQLSGWRPQDRRAGI